METKDFSPELVIRNENLMPFLVKQRMEMIKSFCDVLMNNQHTY